MIPTLPGAAMAVLRGDKVLLQRAIGMADAAHGVRLTPRTRFDLASTSKMFTALAIGMLADRGALAIDDEARRHVPELPSFKAPIRIRHLLYHTSGLRDWNVCFGLMGRDIEDGITKAEIIDFASRQKELNFLPGTAQEYSNTGYNILAEIVARVSGQSFPDWVRKNIIEPAGMNAVVNEDARVTVPDGVLSYTQSVPVPLLSSATSTAAAGSSSLQASLEDMIAWARAFRRIAPGSTIGSSLSGKTGTLDDGTPLEYGAGLWFRNRKDIPFIGHLGLAAGYRISFRRFPVQDLTFIYMTNDGNDGSYLRAETIENLFLGIESDPVEVPDGEYEPAPATGPPDARLQEFAGLYYSDELRTAYEIDNSGSVLTARHAINGSVRLLPSGNDAFGTDRWYMPGVTFVRGKGNRVSGLLVSSEGARNILFRKVSGPTTR
jgi:CubicO group peptidase (beta-lactamase class C family)